MKMALIHLLWVLFLSVAHATPTKRDVKNNADEYMDKLLINVRQLILEKDMDPYTTINYSFLNMHLSGELHGLATLRRAGPAHLTFNKQDDSIQIEAVFGVTDLKVNLKWDISMGFLPFNGYVSGTAADAVTNVVLRVDVNRKTVRITKFKVGQIGHITVETKTMPIPFWDRILSLISSSVSNVMKNTVAKLLEGPIKAALKLKYATPDPNDYVDDIVHHVREYILAKKLDPYNAIDVDILNTHVSGALLGMGTMGREEDAAMIYKPNEFQSIQSKLRVHLLKGQLKWTTKVLSYTITGTASVTIQDVLMDIQLDMNSDKSQFTLKEFDITQVGTISVHLDVVPIFDYVVSSVTNVIAALCKNIVFRLIDGPIKLGLQKVIDEHAFESTMKSVHTSVLLLLLLLSIFGAVQVLNGHIHGTTRLTRETNQDKTWTAKLIANIREVIRKGLAVAHLPPLDPLHIGSLHIYKNLIKGIESYIDVTGDISNLTLTGLSNFSVSDVDLTFIPPRFHANFYLPVLNFSGNNSLDGTIGSWVPMNTRGVFSVAAVNVIMSIDAPLTFEKGFNVILSDLNFKLNVESFNTQLVSGGGFMGGMVNTVLSGTLKTMFDVFVP
uniref:Lipid-binding serum glycoprotein N-terminal domain-containing protein n=1 Tax=Strigamia maritima TaxID=126957 RepID=T1ISX4_STRMM